VPSSPTESDYTDLAKAVDAVAERAALRVAKLLLDYFERERAARAERLEANAAAVAEAEAIVVAEALRAPQKP
jgi:endonuclease/exonuclease/phosphatase family metal-dependent hydrolase